MRLAEYQGKEIIRKYGINIPDASLLTKEQFIRGEIDYSALKMPCVLKAQNLMGGRGKAGGILPCRDIADLRKNTASLFEAGFSGNPVEMILAEEQVPATKETYLSISVDRRAGCFSLMSSGKGGVDVESAASSGTRRVGLSSLIGLQRHQVVYAAKPIIDSGAGEDEATGAIEGLYRLVAEEKALLAEINPLAVCPGGSLRAVDAKIILDGSAPGAKRGMPEAGPENALGSAAAALGVNMVELSGDIAVISNGAGEGMSTLDQIVSAGGALSLWVDLGGGALSAKPEALDNFIERVMDTNPRVLLFTAFFQIGRCDLFAESFRNIYLKRKNNNEYVPKIILRLDGRNADEAKAFSRDTEIAISDSSREACEMAARLSAGGA